MRRLGPLTVCLEELKRQFFSHINLWKNQDTQIFHCPDILLKALRAQMANIIIPTKEEIQQDWQKIIEFFESESTLFINLRQVQKQVS